MALAGVGLAGVGLAGALLLGLEAAPVAGGVEELGVFVSCVVAADEGPDFAVAAPSPDFVGCLGAVGLAAGDAPPPPGREVEVPLPTVARPTVAFPTAPDARDDPPEP